MSETLLPRETVDELLRVLTTVREPEEFKRACLDVMRRFFAEAKGWGWRAGLGSFADQMEAGMHAADARGIPALSAAVNVTDVIMAARALAAAGPSDAETTQDERSDER